MTADTESPYPEHAKLEKVKSRSQAIGEFLAWLQQEKGIFLGRYEQEECADCEEEGEDCGADDHISVFHPFTPSVQRTLADFFGIDYDALQNEKDAMLEDIRQQQEKRCDKCGNVKPDVQRRVDPYTQEIDNEKVEMNLCDDCTQQRTDDI